MSGQSRDHRAATGPRARYSNLARLTVLVSLALPMVFGSCRSPRPPAVPVELDRLETESLRDRRITVTGRVEAVEAALGTERVSFTFELVGSSTESRVTVSESGYNARVLAEVVTLLRRAEDKGFPVHATGWLRSGPHGELRNSRRLELDTLAIDGQVIDTDYRDGYRHSAWRPCGQLMDPNYNYGTCR